MKYLEYELRDCCIVTYRWTVRRKRRGNLTYNYIDKSMETVIIQPRFLWGHPTFCELLRFEQLIMCVDSMLSLKQNDKTIRHQGAHSWLLFNMFQCLNFGAWCRGRTHTVAFYQKRHVGFCPPCSSWSLNHAPNHSRSLTQCPHSTWCCVHLTFACFHPWNQPSHTSFAMMWMSRNWCHRIGNKRITANNVFESCQSRSCTR